MTATTATGFLVVCSTWEPFTNNRNPRYKGVGRIPAYPSEYREEDQANDDYVFGGFKDDETNLIPTFARANELLSRYARSPRSFDLVYCSPEPVPAEQQAALIGPDRRLVSLGYDIASIIDSDYSSIVEDFELGEWALPYLEKLNEHGLFANQQDAVDYVAGYPKRGTPYDPENFDIVFISAIE